MVAPAVAGDAGLPRVPVRLVHAADLVGRTRGRRGGVLRPDRIPHLSWNRPSGGVAPQDHRVGNALHLHHVGLPVATLPRLLVVALVPLVAKGRHRTPHPGRRHSERGTQRGERFRGHSPNGQFIDTNFNSINYVNVGAAYLML